MQPTFWASCPPSPKHAALRCHPEGNVAAQIQANCTSAAYSPSPASPPRTQAHISRYNLRMTQEAAELLKKALSLPVAERADLAGSLIESLDETHDPSVEAAWDEEIQRRMADVDSGKVRPTSLDEARRRLSSALEVSLPSSSL